MIQITYHTRIQNERHPSGVFFRFVGGILNARPTEEGAGSAVKNNWVLFLTSETEPSKESNELSAWVSEVNRLCDFGGQ